MNDRVLIKIKGKKLSFRARISNLTAAKVIALISQEPDSKYLKPPKLNEATTSKERE